MHQLSKRAKTAVAHKVVVNVSTSGSEVPDAIFSFPFLRPSPDFSSCCIDFDPFTPCLPSDLILLICFRQNESCKSGK
jgi:hypothetical protein